MSPIEIQRLTPNVHKLRTVEKLVSAILLVLFIGFVSNAVVLAIWFSRIEGRAFTCNDIGLFPFIEGFWTGINDHQSAGDKISPGWTWDEVRNAAFMCRLAFFAIWIAASATIIRFLWRDSPRKLGVERF